MDSLDICLEVNRVRGFLKTRAALWGGSQNEDYSILESILGPAYLRQLPYILGEYIGATTRIHCSPYQLTPKPNCL